MTRTFAFLSLFQLHPQVLPEVQPELPEECGQPAGHAALPGGGGHNLQPGRGARARPLREHVRPQQLQARQEGQEE